MRHRLRSLLAAIVLGATAAAWPSAPIAQQAAAATLPSGFSDQAIVTGLKQPTVVSFASDGRVFVAEKRGVVKTWDDYADFVANAASTDTIDLRTEVMNYWDRGLLGMALDPNYPSSPYLYLLYTYDALPGGSAPEWGTAGVDSDSCPTPPGGNSEGCVVQGRLDRVTISAATGVSSGRSTLITGWCQQFPSHSIGSLVFGADGKLYVSAGDGASFNQGWNDVGQYGGTKPDTTNPVTPANPCGDPPGSVGVANSLPTGEGGALRSQSLRRSGGQVLLNGSVLRVDPATGAGSAGNPLEASGNANARRIVAYGFRNPFRITIRPGTNDLWIGDVGDGTWEELDRLANPTAAATPPNYAWPCGEGPDWALYFTSTPNLCASLTQGQTVAPTWYYEHGSHLVTGDGCNSGDSSSISGVAFHNASNYPSQYTNALFVADYSRDCIVVIPAGAGGVPDPSSAMGFEAAASNPVGLSIAPDGDLIYADLGTTATNGAIHRIRYNAPTASFTVSPSSGPVPLDVDFDASASTGVGPLQYEWDFDGNGTYDQTTSSTTTSHSYNTPATYHPKLRVTDANDVTATTTRTVGAGNSPPVLTIDSPTAATTWKVGDTINITAHATDAQDGSLPPSSLDWTAILEHCPSDCHEHFLTSGNTISGASVIGPDHDYPSFIRITVTATDSGGLTDTESVDIQPKTSTITVHSNPDGLPVTLRGTTANGTVGPTTVIVGGASSVSAATSANLGGTNYEFLNWSDGGAQTHNVTATTSNKTLTANYGTDVPSNCNTPATISTAGSVRNSNLANGTDVDWFRFTLSSTQDVRIVVGNLTADAAFDLWHACSSQLVSVDHSGTGYELGYRTLPAGTYSVRVRAKGSATEYGLSVRALGSSTVKILSSRGTITSGTLRITGELMNPSSLKKTATVTIKLQNASGTTLKTLTAPSNLSVIVPHGASSFGITSSVPSGYAKYVATVSGTTTSSTRYTPDVTITTNAAVSTGWKVSGTVRNQYGFTLHSVRAPVLLFDAMGNVLDVRVPTLSSTTFGSHVTRSFTVTFPPAGIDPDRTSVYRSGIR